MKDVMKSSSAKKNNFSFMFPILSFLTLLLVTHLPTGFAATVYCDHKDDAMIYEFLDVNFGGGTSYMVGKSTRILMNCLPV